SIVEEKVIIFIPEYCSGCMRCMTTCSTYNTGATSLSKSCIHIARHEGHTIIRIDEEDDLLFQALSCQQCETPSCQYVCPTRAIERNRETGGVTIKYERCIGCRMCIVGCPFGAIAYDPGRNQVMKCDLCGGEPQCVRFCPTGALQFIAKKLAHLPKRDLLAKKLTQSRTTISKDIQLGEKEYVSS
ncbi:MAG: 4Fe-4S dicluster domain-containing protein, partial [Desulfobacteraceae bacterium]|nr:4Fe-4S dicluster domain-containing protein [Desulfobacteraceae bacterium]